MKNLVKLSVAALLMTMATSCCNCKKDHKGPKDFQKECVCPEGAPCANGCADKCGCPDHKMGPRDMKRGHEGMPQGECPMKMQKKNHREMNPEQREQIEKWMKFDSLSVDEQKALIAERKAAIDKRDAEIEAMKAEKKARMEEINEKWKNFDKLSIEEQKELIDMKSFKFRHARRMHPNGPRGDHGHGPRN